MTRILVTGASGFIGRQAVAALVSGGAEVHGVSSRAPGPAEPGVTWHQADLLKAADRELLVRQLAPSHLLHLAWYAVPGRFWTAAENLVWLEASLGLLRVFVEAGGRRVVGAGSCAEYDWTAGWCDERETPCRPATLYGAAKHALHTVLDAFARQHGVSSAWGRIFFLYGPGEPAGRLVSSVASSLAAGRPVPCSDGLQHRDFLHVADVGDALAALLLSPVTGAVNVASGQAIAVRDVVARLAEIAGRRDLIRWGALPRPPGDPDCIAARVVRLTEEIGWAPRRPLDEGLADTLRWWRERKPDGDFGR